MAEKGQVAVDGCRLLPFRFEVGDEILDLAYPNVDQTAVLPPRLEDGKPLLHLLARTQRPEPDVALHITLGALGETEDPVFLPLSKSSLPDRIPHAVEHRLGD